MDNYKWYNRGVMLMVATWLLLVPVLAYIVIVFAFPQDQIVQMRANAKADQLIEDCFRSGGCVKSYEVCQEHTMVYKKK
jgi:uncharacterized membrane protein YeiB